MGIKAGFKMNSTTLDRNDITIGNETYTGFIINIQVVYPTEIFEKHILSGSLPLVEVNDILIDQGRQVWKVNEIISRNDSVYQLKVYILNGYDFKNPITFHRNTQLGLICTPINGALPVPVDNAITDLAVFRQAVSYTFESGGGGGGGTGGSVDGIGSSSSTNPGSDLVGVKSYGQIIHSGTLTNALQSIYLILSEATAGTESNVGANKIVKRDNSGSFFANEVKAVATSAKWADFAEKYTYKNTDDEVGLTVCVSTDPDFESEKCEEDCSLKVIGIISKNPGYLINSESDGVIVALKGMVPAFVKGPVKKGDILVSTTDGCLRAATNKTEELYRVALSLETKNNNELDIIKVIL